MFLYEKIINNTEYIKMVKEIEKIKFITDGKWDWEHGLGHYKRVSLYVKQILEQLSADNRTIELGMTAALLHDIGLSKGDKINHAVESSRIFEKFIDLDDINEKEKEILRQAIYDHSKGNNIQSLVGLSLVLADKLDVTYHRTVNSSIQDNMNKEIQKIKKVNININDNELIVTYTTDSSFDISILRDWDKCVKIPAKVANYLGKKFIFLVNNQQINLSDIFAL
ncbi:MAG: HD domain-containing protein [Bacilli bacterium]|nr:HD domain-containing protein [Bacilli bacterium]